MEVNFTSTGLAGCAHPELNSQGHQLHLPISSLPCPTEPLSITSFPIELVAESKNYDAKNIANLWLQFLSIQIRTGNFWTWEEALKTHNEVRSREAVVKKKQVRERTYLYIRSKLLSGFLGQPPAPLSKEELLNLVTLITRLEDEMTVPASVLRASSIHKVLKKILNLEVIPGDSDFDLRRRFGDLLTTYQATLNNTESEESSDANQPEKLARDEPKPDEMTEMPRICITQLTSSQCAQLLAAASECTPALSPRVVELACIIPYFSSTTDREHQVVIGAKLPQGVLKWERSIYPGGPTIPPHMFQLTESNHGMAAYIDTNTGEALMLKHYMPQEYAKDGSRTEVNGVLCTVFEGPRKPAEELLQEWIDNFLSMKWVAHDGGDIWADEYRSMDSLKHKALLLEFGWPHSFPLSWAQHNTFLKRKHELYEAVQYDHKYKKPLHLEWENLKENWYKATGFNSIRNTRDPARMQEIETLKMLDDQIFTALRHHVLKKEDYEYALAADVPMQKQFLSTINIGPRMHNAQGWSVEITPKLVFERVEEVLRSSPQDDSEGSEVVSEEIWQQIWKVIKDAYDREVLKEQGGYVGDEMEGEDDDETSTYKPSDEEEGEEEVDTDWEELDEEFESDEEDESLDFDVVMLVEDAKSDIEPVRRAMEEFSTLKDVDAGS